MLPACIVIAALAMLTGISGTSMLTLFLIMVFPFLGVPILTPAQAIGMALLTEFFGFISGVAGYHRRRLIDYRTGWKLIAVSVPTVVVFSFLSQYTPRGLIIIAYGIMMILLAAFLAFSAPSNVRNAHLKILPKAVALTPRRREAKEERVIKSRDGTEYRYKVCDQLGGNLITAAGASMEGLVSVGLGELEMPNLVKRCKIPVAVSAATSVFVIAITVLSGSITAILVLVSSGGVNAVPWNLVIYTVPGAVIGGQLGSKFQGRISSEKMERYISILFAVIGVAFLVASAMTLLR